MKTVEIVKRTKVKKIDLDKADVVKQDGIRMAFGIGMGGIGYSKFRPRNLP